MSLACSERRRLLDRSVGACARLIRGRVLEIGAGRAPRRGRLVPQRTPGWWTLELVAAVRLEPLLVCGQGALISATTEYLALGRK